MRGDPRQLPQQVARLQKWIDKQVENDPQRITWRFSAGDFLSDAWHRDDGAILLQVTRTLSEEGQAKRGTEVAKAIREYRSFLRRNYMEAFLKEVQPHLGSELQTAEAMDELLRFTDHLDAGFSDFEAAAHYLRKLQPVRGEAGRVKHGPVLHLMAAIMIAHKAKHDCCPEKWAPKLLTEELKMLQELDYSVKTPDEEQGTLIVNDGTLYVIRGIINELVCTQEELLQAMEWIAVVEKTATMPGQREYDPTELRICCILLAHLNATKRSDFLDSVAHQMLPELSYPIDANHLVRTLNQLSLDIRKAIYTTSL